MKLHNPCLETVNNAVRYLFIQNNLCWFLDNIYLISKYGFERTIK